jgi:hypothetical protein
MGESYAPPALPYFVHESRSRGVAASSLLPRRSHSRPRCVHERTDNGSLATTLATRCAPRKCSFVQMLHYASSGSTSAALRPTAAGFRLPVRPPAPRGLGEGEEAALAAGATPSTTAPASRSLCLLRVLAAGLVATSAVVDAATAAAGACAGGVLAATAATSPPSLPRGASWSALALRDGRDTDTSGSALRCCEWRSCDCLGRCSCGWRRCPDRSLLSRPRSRPPAALCESARRRSGCPPSRLYRLPPLRLSSRL